MARPIPKDPLLVVLGATGTGKSQLAIDLATRFNGEIINGDAMQMYDGLPIITNKVTMEEQKGIPHHLIGFIALDEEPWRVGLFKAKACQIIQDIRSRGRLPILVGGTHYYIQSLLFKDKLVLQQQADGDHNGLSNEELLERFPILGGPTEAILQHLKEVDPVMAAQWHPNDRRRIRRSLEIFLLTGKIASEIYREQKENRNSRPSERNTFPEETPSQIDSTLFLWVHSEGETLKKRLDCRVDKMLQAGLLEEVKSMDSYLQQKIETGAEVERDRGIWVSIGYKEFEHYHAELNTDTPQDTLDKLLKLSVEQVKAATRQYSKRQVRWIRLQLMASLADENCLDKLFLLDGTDINDWSNSVFEPAAKITETFLAGDQLPLPTELSTAAETILAPKKSYGSGAKLQRLCETCWMPTYTEVEWQKHVQSRGHRARVKNDLKKTGRRWKHGVKEGLEGLDVP